MSSRPAGAQVLRGPMAGFLWPRLGGVTLLALLTVGALLALAEGPSTGTALVRFRLEFFPLLLSLAATAYAIRFAKWSYLVHLGGLPLSGRDSLLVFLGGLSMAITPAKLGELFKAYLINRLDGTPVRRSIPLVIVDRATDLVALVFLAALGATVFRRGIPLLAGIVLALAVGIGMTARPRLTLGLLRRLEHIRPIAKSMAAATDSYEAARPLLTPTALVVASGLAVCAWSLECLSLYFVLVGLGEPHGLLVSSFVFSFSTIAGAVSMLPGGLGVAEGNLTAWMLWFRLPLQVAAAATLIIRLSTLWFGVLIGIGTLVRYRGRFFAATQGGAAE